MAMNSLWPRRTGVHSRRAGVAGLVVAALLTVLSISCSAPSPKAVEVAPALLPNLILGPEELPFDAILGRLEAPLASEPDELREIWCGLPDRRPECIEAGARVCGPEGKCTCSELTHWAATIGIVITESSQQAAETVGEMLRGVALPPQEVPDTKTYSQFADRIWYGDNARGSAGGIPTGARLIMVRGNVVESISMSRRGGLSRQVLFDLAARAGRKVDAAAQGHPKPVPVLPLGADQELRVGLEQAWKLHSFGRRLWGDKATTIALYDTNGLPRSLPATQIEGGDYLVPLKYLLAIASPAARVKIRGGRATVTIAGKALVLEQGESEVRGGPRAAQLSRPAELAEGQVLVPLSPFARQVLDRGITWGHAGTVPLGRLQ
jgi:hypothetical protein